MDEHCQHVKWRQSPLDCNICLRDEVERLKHRLKDEHEEYGRFIQSAAYKEQRLREALEPFAKFWEVTHNNKTSFNRPGPIFGINRTNFDFEDIKRAHKALKEE